MKLLPKLSIVVPVFNMSQTLERCILFILNQSYKNFEVIFVDDCSTDESCAIIEKYQEINKDKITLLKSNTQGGPGQARNIGLKKATGKYVSFVDADDWIDESLYSTVLEQMEKENADVSIFGVKDEYENCKNPQIRYHYPHKNNIDNVFALTLLSRLYSNDTYISPMVCHKIYRLDLIKNINLEFMPNTYFEDDLFTFLLLLHKCNITFVPNVYYHYYQHQGSITHTFSKKHIDDYCQFVFCLRQYLIDNNLWNNYQNNYYSYCQKCMRSTLCTLFNTEQDINTQKNYIVYFINKISEVADVNEWIKHIDISIIKRLLL